MSVPHSKVNLKLMANEGHLPPPLNLMSAKKIRLVETPRQTKTITSADAANGDTVPTSSKNSSKNPSLLNIHWILDIG